MNDWVSLQRTVERVTESKGTPAEKAPFKDLGTDLIPKERYISREYMDKEWETLWTKVWNYGCHVNDVADPGEFFALDFGRENLIFLRTQSGEIKGYYNVCQHRGNRICQQQTGCVNSLKCSFHHWEWNLDGTVKTIPDPETFRQGIDEEQLRLPELRVDVWEGMIFFNMDPDCEPLSDYLENLPEHIAPYDFENRVCVQVQSVEWDCNWKTSVDAFLESYHVQGIHPQLMEYLNDYDTQIDIYGRHNRTLFPYMYVSPRYEDQEKPSDTLAAVLDAFGYNPNDFVGRPQDARKAIQKAKRAAQDVVPHPYKNLNDDQLTDNYHYLIFPTLQFNIFAEANLMFRTRPHATDPQKCYFDMWMFATNEPGMEHIVGLPQFKHGETTLGEVLDQDARNLPFVQRGMNSRGFKGLYLSEQEERIRHFHAVVTDYVGE